MAYALALLRSVQWNGIDVVGDRSRALLASLAEARGTAMSAGTLIDGLWPEAPPADPQKALQVVVSRTRKATDTSVIARTAGGYRLGVPTDQVDALDVLEQARHALRAMTDGDWHEVRKLTESLADVIVTADHGDGPLERLRSRADRALREAGRVRAIALSRLGEHEAARPLLERHLQRAVDDELLRGALLRSIAATQGASAALEQYERYRRDLADRLGVDPGTDLQRLHAELLAADHPIRAGVLYDDTSLIGREEDLLRLGELIRTSRVTTILGPGGLGKTRLAHVLGREAEQPAVRFVELVGVTSSAGLLPALGSALGVRETSGAGTRPLDLRTRIIENLGSVPTLLILDNCEQIITAVAELVATLVAHTRDLTVLTTSRSPLGIRAERVYPLGELSQADGVALFRDRATAARPGVVLDEDAVLQLVRRLDGLPLAIELAAARVRAMSVRDILARIDRRFALLRGASTVVHERHQTLLAVIDWSWNLLDEQERAALRWLSVFHDGFTLAAAERVLDDPGAVSVIQALIEHSLLTVQEDGELRYRMLETVREFGRDRLEESGEGDTARAALRDWAVHRCRELDRRLMGPDQVAAVHALRAEVGNLFNELRIALDDEDASAVLSLFGALMIYWEITDGYPRLPPHLDRIASLMIEYQEKPDERPLMRRVLSTIVLGTAIARGQKADEPIAKLRSVGPGDDPWFAGPVEAVLALSDAADEDIAASLTRLSDSEHVYVKLHALRWLCHFRENAGDLSGALKAASRAVEACPTGDGPWLPATTRSMRAHLLLQLGRRDEAVLDAELAIDPLMQLHAAEDAMRLRLMIALAHVAGGRIERARATVEEVAASGYGRLSGGAGGVHGVRAEIAAAVGDGEQAKSLMRRGLEVNRAITIPGVDGLTGFEPWTLVSLANCVVMEARFPGPDDNRELIREAIERLPRVIGVERQMAIDMPVVGCLAFAIGHWGLAHGEFDQDLMLRLFVIARRFGYHQGHPSADWSIVEQLTERVVPGRLDELVEEYADRPTGELLDELRILSASLSLA